MILSDHKNCYTRYQNLAKNAVILQRLYDHFVDTMCSRVDETK